MLRMVSQIFNLLEEAKAIGKPPNVISMNAAMTACVHCGDIDRALDLFDEMCEPGGCGPDSITYGILLKVYSFLPRPDNVASLHAVFLFFMLHSVCLVICIQQSTAVRQLLSWQLSQGLCGSPNNSLPFLSVQGLGKAHKLDDAFELLEQMEAGTAPGRPQLQEVHLNTLLNACADVGEARRARGVLQRFRAYGKGLGPSPVTYNILIKVRQGAM